MPSRDLFILSLGCVTKTLMMYKSKFFKIFKKEGKMVSDEFWAASMGFPKNWIRPVLRSYEA